MKNEDPYITIVDSVFSEAVKGKVVQLTATDEQMNGRTIVVDNKNLINFSSCSYLGLELDPRLRDGVIDAVSRHGTQFASSRGYVSSPLYLEVDDLITQIFGAYPLVYATTTLGSIATLPVVIAPKDAIIQDLQVHSSVQLAASLCKLKGTHIEIIRHSQMDMLEDSIKTLRNRGAKNIWYLADGVYSMYGDLAPVDDLITLLNKYDNFYLYIDDAHGAGWAGVHGRGTVLGHREIHPKMIVAVTFAKSFAAAGSAIIFPNEEWRRKVKNCGGPSIFSGPIQPPLLGALIASAKLHLSDEIVDLQHDEYDKILYCNELLNQHNLPLLGEDNTPIRFIGLGLLSVAINLVKRLIKEGFYTNLALFPAVPIKRCGVRLAIHRQLEKEDIKALVQAMQHHLPLTLQEENYELDFLKTFGDVIPRKSEIKKSILTHKPQKSKLKLIYETTIDNVPQQEWDEKLGFRGTYSSEGLKYMEKVFRDNPEPENNWKFHYYTIKDETDNIVLMTLFVTSICKDDIFSPGSVSEKLEEERKRRGDPYYFSSKTLVMGTLFSEGNHLYLDRSRDWQGALKLLIDNLKSEQEKDNIEAIVLRDLPDHDQQMDDFLLTQGYVKMSLPDTHIFENQHNDFEKFLDSLPAAKRRFIRKKVLENESLFEVKIFGIGESTPTKEEIESFYKLYENVASKGYDINTYPIPKTTFKAMMQSKAWEIVALYLKDDPLVNKLPIAYMAAVKNGTASYCPLVIGLNYEYVESHGAYRQTLYQLIKRGIDLKAKIICFGMTASHQKIRLGMIPHEIVAYFQTTDTYKMEVMGSMIVERKTFVE